MSRSKWKGSFSQEYLLKNKYSNVIKKIWSRNSCIPKSFLNSKVLIHSGKNFRLLNINEDIIGLKFGAFCFTRTRSKKPALNKNIIKKSKIKK